MMASRLEFRHFIPDDCLAGINAGDVRLSCRIECLQHSWYFKFGYSASTRTYYWPVYVI